MTSHSLAKKTSLQAALGVLWLSAVALPVQGFNGSDQCEAEWVGVYESLLAMPQSLDYSSLTKAEEAKRKCLEIERKRSPDWPAAVSIAAALCGAEIDQALGHIDAAQARLKWITTQNQPQLAAQAQFRLAEIAELELMSEPRPACALRDASAAMRQRVALLEGVGEVREAYLAVLSHKDSFWSKRAAFRLITLMDDALFELSHDLGCQLLPFSASPFAFLFTQSIRDDAREQQMIAFEEERALLEATLLAALERDPGDGSLQAALNERAKDAYSFSPSLETRLFTPWQDNLTAGTIVKQKGRYFQIESAELIKVLPNDKAIAALRTQLSDASKPRDLAFALAYLSEEKGALTEEPIIAGLASEDATIRLAALYAAQQLPSQSLVEPLLSLLEKSGPLPSLFLTPQRQLFGEPERILLALSSHMALGREASQALLESALLRDEEKAWLLQFRKDKRTTERANRYLSHKNPLVRARARYAMQQWQAAEY